jgi:hypothetical protein
MSCSVHYHYAQYSRRRSVTSADTETSNPIKTCPGQCWCIVVPGFTGAGLRCITSNRYSPILFWQGSSKRVRRCLNEQTIDVNS